MRRLIFISYVFSFFIFYPLHSFGQQGWNRLNSGTTINLNSIFFTEVNTGYVAGFNGLIRKTTDGGLNWVPQVSGTSENIKDIYFVNQLGFTVSDSIYRTTNGGLEWNALPIPEYFGFNEIFMVNMDTIYLAGNRGIILKSTNGGSGWFQLYLDTGFASGYNITSIYFVNSKTGYAGGNYRFHAGGIFLKTFDGGNTWFENFAGNSVRSINFTTIESGYYAYGGIRKTTNTGINWSGHEFGTGNIITSVFFANPNTGYGAGFTFNSSLIVKTTNAGGSWNIQYSPPDSLFSIYFVNNSIGYACGKKGTILKTTTGGVSPVISISNEVPDKFKLYQNYPNPFNPSTIIQFDIARKSDVNLSVYDLSGRKTDELLNEVLDPGSYNYSFNGVNYASGVYLYVLQADNYSLTRKMILLK